MFREVHKSAKERRKAEARSLSFQNSAEELADFQTTESPCILIQVFSTHLQLVISEKPQIEARPFFWHPLLTDSISGM